MHFNSKPGFMLMEVVIAVAIMGIMFSAVFALQSQVLRSVMWVTQRFERTLQARSFLVESADKSDEKQQDVATFDKKITRPATQLQYKKSKVAADGPFGKSAHDMYKQQVTITWQDGTKKYQDAILAYVYRPAKKKPAAGAQAS